MKHRRSERKTCLKDGILMKMIKQKDATWMAKKVWKLF